VDDADVTALCRYAAAAAPAQQWDEFTADVWTDILRPYDFTLEECRAAVVAIKRRQQWVDVSDVIAEVKLARRPAAEAAWVHTLADPAAYRAHIEAQDSAFMRQLDERRGSTRRLRAVPAPDYEGEGAG
jgi:hypothetical protein